jgi:peptide/nickel transport system permease protein
LSALTQSLGKLRRRSSAFRLGPVLVGLFALAAIVGPWLAPHDPMSIDLDQQFDGPSAAHPLGTADNGVDLLSALLHGARLAGLVSLVVVGLSVGIGALVGAWAGLRGGAMDLVAGGAMDLVQSFPAIILNIAILALAAEPSLMHLIVALTVPGWVLYARLARAEAMALREREFVQAARTLGAPDGRLLFRHILPNLAGPILIQATSAFGGVVLAESTLSFLGLGPATHVSWGALLDQGSGVLLRFPHVALLSGTAIALTVLGFNLTGDWLRDRLDVRSR